jgi:hypothetical protein
MAMIGIGAENAGIAVQMTESGWAYFADMNGSLQQINE